MSSSDGGSDGDKALHVNRRDVLRLSSLAALAGTAVELQGCGHRQVRATERLRVAREEDMAVLEIGLVEMSRSEDDTTLSWSDNRVARIILYLQPQHILEGAYLGNETPDDPVPTRLSGETQLVFQPPEASGSLPFTFEALLDRLSDWAPAVDPRAQPPHDVPEPSTTLPPLPSTSTVGETFSRLRQRRNAATSPASMRLGLAAVGTPSVSLPSEPWARPEDGVTKIELPFRLLLSPSRFGRFLHPARPVQGTDGTVALWSSRLAALGPHGQAADDRFAAHRTVRAIWTRDLDLPSGRPAPGPAPVDAVRDDSPFENSAARPSLEVADRTEIALLSSYPNLREVDTPSVAKRAEPIRVDRLWVSALGGGLDCRAEWTEARVPGAVQPNLNLVKWDHKATLGRDHHAEVQRTGYLWPTGHRAVYTQVTERRVSSDNKAVLRQRGFIVIGEVTRAWAPASGEDATWRQVPLRSVTFLDTVVPCQPISNVDNDAMQALVLAPGGGDPATARVLVEDRHGQTHDTSMGFVFFTSPPAFDEARVGVLNDALESVKSLPMGCQRVAYADEGDPAGVMVETHSLRWEGRFVERQVLPVCTEASLVIDAARTLLQSSDAGAQATPMTLHAAYLQNGFGPGNANQVLFGARDPDTGPVLDFESDSRRSGGFVSPSFRIGGLSALNGPIGGDPDAFADGGFDAASYFDDIGPKLFGVLSLSDLLEDAGAPSILSSAAESLESLLSDVDRFRRLGNVSLPTELPEIPDLQPYLDAAVARAEAALDAVAEGDFEALKTELRELKEEVEDVQARVAGLTVPTEPVLKSLQPLLARLVTALGTAKSVVDAALTLQKAIEQREIKLSWEAPLTEIPDLFFPKDPLVLEVVVNASTGGVDMTARLDNFVLSLFGIVSLPVERFSFLQRTGSKPDIDVKLGSTEFQGMLAFMQSLIEILPVDGFSDPPAIQVDERGLLASLSLPLPNVSVGVFSIENMNLSAALEVPFIGQSILFTFGFCSRDNPFVLTVMCVGGGGFFSIEVTPNGLRMVETALEARASLGVDFGVASGSVSIAVGIYLNLHMAEPDAPRMMIEGYVTFRGEVSVLGIVSASLMLHLSIEYQSEGNKVFGEAEMTIEISILCFSASVTVSCRRQFSGDNQDPTFLETMAPVDPLQPMLGADSVDSPWARYVNAFLV